MAGLFDFEALNAEIQTQQQITNARQAEQVATAKKQSAIKDRSAELAHEQDQNMGFLRDSITQSQQKANKARALADSENPLDTLKLMGLQALDPAGYRRDVRTARIAEDTQRAGALSAVYGVSQAALQADLVASTGKLTTLEQLESIGMEKLKAVQTANELMQGNLKAAQGLKDAALYGMDEESVAKALKAAEASGVANINGIEVDKRTLETRVSDLKEESYQIRVKAYLRALGDDEAANVNHTLKQREYNRTLETGKMQDVDLQLAIEKAERLKQFKGILNENEQKLLITKPVSELLAYKAAGYRDEAGNDYSPANVENAIAQRNQLESDRFAQEMKRSEIENFDSNVLNQELGRLDEISKRYGTNTPLAASAKQFRTVIGLAGINAGKEVPIEQRALAVGAFYNAQAQFDKAIQLQAKAEGGKDEAKVEMLTEYYRGNPIPEEKLVSSVSSRLAKNQPIVDLVPAQMAASIRSNYQQIYQNLTREKQAFGASLPKADREAIQAEAAQQAVTAAVESTAQGRSNEILANQVLDASHPMRGFPGMNPGKMATILGQSDATAFANWKHDNGLDDKTALAIKLGQPLPEGVTTQKPDDVLRNELSATENTQFLMSLEGIQLGLGDATAEWWQSKGEAYINNEQAAMQKTPKTFQESVQRGLTNEVERNQVLSYGQGLADSSQYVKQEAVKRRSEFLTFGGNPENTQVIILQNDKELTGDQKKQIFTNVINPALAEAQQMGLGFEEANAFVEAKIANFKSDDQALTGYMKTMKRNRGDIIANVQSVSTVGGWLFDAAWQTTSPMGIAGGIAKSMVNPAANMKPNPIGLEWYTSIKAGR